MKTQLKKRGKLRQKLLARKSLRHKSSKSRSILKRRRGEQA